tara:strand:+ start:198 stop:932 length:735 start_codon:yes stop_codon:yes gene_type:complete
MKKKKTTNFKNAGNGSDHEDKVVNLFNKLGFHAERVGGKGNAPDIYAWDGNLKYGVECKASEKGSASYVTFKAYYDFTTETLSYKTNAECKEVQQSKSRLFESIKESVTPYFKETKIIEIWCEDTKKNYSALIPKNQPNSNKLKKEIVRKNDNIIVDSSLVYDILVAKGNDYLAIGSSIIPLVDDYLHLPKLLTKKKAPNYFYVRVRSKKVKANSQEHSLEIQVFCGGYTHKTPKVNSKVKIER